LEGLQYIHSSVSTKDGDVYHPKQKKRPVRLKGEPADLFTLVDDFRALPYGVVAMQLSLRNIRPVERAFVSVPERVFTNFAVLFGQGSDHGSLFLSVDSAVRYGVTARGTPEPPESSGLLADAALPSNSARFL
jgi:hypothetical protein